MNCSCKDKIDTEGLLLDLWVKISWLDDGQDAIQWFLKRFDSLREAAPDIEKMGFGLDIDANADMIPVIGMPNGMNGGIVRTEKKVYPNDPCPCGSGKKYKKCCGRK